MTKRAGAGRNVDNKLTGISGGKDKNPTGGETMLSEQQLKEQAETAAALTGQQEAEGGTNSESKVSDDEFDKGERDGNKGEDDSTEDGEGQAAFQDDGSTKIEPPTTKDTQEKPVLAPFVRQTKIEKSSNNITIKSLFKEWKKDQLLKAEWNKAVEEAKAKGEEIPENPTNLRFDLAIQRNEVWSDMQRSDLIHSILYGYYVPPVLVKDTADGKKWFLDGKQRLTTIMTFLNGDWALNKKTATVYGHKISGFKFKDLPEEMQETIFDETLMLVRMKNMTNQERDAMFVKLNGGSPLTRMELTRAKHSELIESINALAELKFFKNDIELSSKARVRYVDQEIILQIAMLFEEGKEKIKGFSANNIEEYVTRLKEAEKTLSDELVTRFTEIAAYLDLALEGFAENESEVRKAMKKIHIPIIFYTADLAMRTELDPKLFGDFINSFLIKNYSIESAYGKSCQSGSSKKENVLVRLDTMTASLKEFMDLIRNFGNDKQALEEFNKRLADQNGIDHETADSEEEATA